MLLTLPQQIRRKTHAIPIPPWIGAAGLAAAVGVAYFLAAHLSLALLAEPDGVAVFWPASGIAAGLLIALGRDARWPVAAGVAGATIVANLMGDRDVAASVAFAVCDAGEALLAAWLTERYFGYDFGSLRCVLGFLAAATIATAASGVGGAAAYKLFHSPAVPVSTTWLHWFAADAVGMIAAGPLVIAMREPPPRGEIIEGIAALTVLVVLTAAIVALPLARWETMGLAALVFPVLLWIAARYQPVFAAAAAFAQGLTIVCAITFRVGNFGDTVLPLGDQIVIAQTTIVGVALCAYVLAALFAERRRHEAAIEESEARLQEALKAGAVTAFEWNPRSGWSQRSENAEQILGRCSELSSAQFLNRIHPDDRTSFKALIHRTCVDNPAYSATFRFIRPDGREVWLEETARGEFDANGHFVRLKGLTRDITQRKRAEERQDLLIAELDHRVKNVLARVAVVAMHTRQGQRTIDEFVAALDGRLQSMSAAHALLSQSRWCGVGLTDLIRRQLAPYTTDANTTISGPDVMLTPAQTQALAMVIHELVTNAAKYGALSSPHGHVSVGWDLIGARNVTLTITWRELGGPPISPPLHTSYGSSLIRDLIPHELDGTVDLTFPAEGACCTIAIGLERREEASQAAS
jgi:PAS domain S-box-containing protein